jgi:hypothetical protein
LETFQAQETYPLVDEPEMLKASYPDGLERERPAIVSQAAYSVTDDPFGDPRHRSKLRKTRPEVTAPDNFRMTKVVETEHVTVADFGKAQASIPPSATPLLRPGARVKHRGKPGTIRDMSTAATNDPTI